MSAFEKIKASFETTWTTVLVGWNGLGAFSPWPDRADDFPPLLSADEVAAYASERLASSSDADEEEQIVQLLSLDLPAQSRQKVRELLTRLSDADGSDPAIEIRKWRLVLLEELLDDVPKDALYGLTALTEFWQGFGFPADSPHEVQRREDGASPDEYYQDQNLERLLALHWAWIREERATLKAARGRKKGQNRMASD